MNSRDAVEF